MNIERQTANVEVKSIWDFEARIPVMLPLFQIRNSQPQIFCIDTHHYPAMLFIEKKIVVLTCHSKLFKKLCEAFSTVIETQLIGVKVDFSPDRLTVLVVENPA